MFDYFSLFTASNTYYQEVIDDVSFVVPEYANVELSHPVTEDEVRKVVFKMHPDISPGPDGMTPAYYQKYWHIVKVDVVELVQHFFETCSFEDGCGDANVVLIPKKAIILESQNLVRKETHWCVGNGGNIMVLGESWLLDEDNLSSPPFIMLFAIDRKLIENIPLNVSQVEDHLVWRNKNSGFYSVKSAYALLQKIKTSDVNEHWTLPQANSIKVNVDATLFDGGRSFDLGVAACNSYVFFGRRLDKTSFSHMEPALVEAIGIREILSWLSVFLLSFILLVLTATIFWFSASLFLYLDMDPLLHSLDSTLNLTEEESSVAVLPTEVDNASNTNSSHILIARILTENYVHKPTFYDQMGGHWKGRFPVVISEYGNGLFKICFRCA
uniref:Uncharacterized protein n=1 Tax=Cannabis sativa TaxID=3483 RepID=A0A803QIB0_CANSA